MAEGGWTRRDFAGAAALLAMVVGVPVAVLQFPAQDDADALTERQRDMIREVAQQVIPRTETAGAGDVGVGDFVILALAHGLDGTRTPASAASSPYALPDYRRRDGSLRYLSWLEQALDRQAKGDWLARPSAQRGSDLAAIDAAAFLPEAGDHPWKKIKGLIVTGYYTSEVGGSKELNYELVPGRYDPAVPVHPGDKGYSSDWTGVDFG